jgi:hypothetical protein
LVRVERHWRQFSQLQLVNERFQSVSECRS